MPRAVDSRWFALADLGCAGAAACLCVLRPNLGWAPLTIGALPWVSRLAARRPPFRRTRLDGAVVAFVATALVAVWAAYDRPAAWTKLQWVLASVLVYYALAGQPAENHWPITGGFVVAAVPLAAILLAARAGGGLDGMGRLSAAAADALASLLSLLFPFCLVAVVASHRARRRDLTLVSIAVGVLAVVGLMASGERTTWVAALSAALCLVVSWRLGRRVRHGDGAPGRVGFRRRWMLGTAAVVVLAIGAWMARPAISEVLRDVQAPQRFEMDRNTLRLAGDFLITGGGLGSFPGLYSRYILLIPVLFSPTSHNLYLDVLTEQGVGGLLAVAALIAGSAWLLVNVRESTAGGAPEGALLRYATLASIAALMVTGLLEDPLYETPGLVMWLLPLGMAASVTGGLVSGSRVLTESGATGSPATRRSWRRWAVGILAVSFLAVFFYRPLLSVFWSNLGSVTLARQELAGWPDNTARQDPSGDSRALARILFDRGLALDPTNVTAQYRIGLMAMDARDFGAALAPLRTALSGDPGHRGIRKALAYDLTWLGLIDQSQPFFARIAEAPQELGVYSWWWGTQGRADLASLALQMAARLKP